MQAWTVRAVVEWTAKDLAARGVSSPRLDAELLVAEALSLTRVRLYMDLDRPLVEAERGRIRDLVKRRRAREPIAYILGRREFYGHTFAVSPAVLIPRPDTETLVERALEVLAEDAVGPALDLCTGSGAIGLTLAKERSALAMHVTDLSADALAVARANAASLGVGERVTLLEGDLFAPLSPGTQYVLIACNPPYLAEAEMPALEPDVRDHEPRMALCSGPTGLELYARLAGEAGGWLTPGGTMLLEVGAGQAAAVQGLLDAALWVASTRTHADLAGILRVVEATKKRD